MFLRGTLHCNSVASSPSKGRAGSGSRGQGSVCTPLSGGPIFAPRVHSFVQGIATKLDWRTKDVEGGCWFILQALENRTLDSKREMDIMNALDEMKSLKARQERVDSEALLSALKRSGDDEEVVLDEADEAAVRAHAHFKSFVEGVPYTVHLRPVIYLYLHSYLQYWLRWQKWLFVDDVLSKDK